MGNGRSLFPGHSCTVPAPSAGLNPTVQAPSLGPASLWFRPRAPVGWPEATPAGGRLGPCWDGGPAAPPALRRAPGSSHRWVCRSFCSQQLGQGSPVAAAFGEVAGQGCGRTPSDADAPWSPAGRGRQQAWAVLGQVVETPGLPSGTAFRQPPPPLPSMWPPARLPARAPPGEQPPPPMRPQPSAPWVPEGESLQGRSGERVRQPVGARASRGSRCVSPCPGQHLLSGLGDPRGGPHGGGAVFARPAPWSPRGRPLAVGEGPGHVPVSRSACPLTGSSCHLRVGEGPGPAAGRLLTSGTAGAGVAVCPHGHSEPSGHATSQGVVRVGS